MSQADPALRSERAKLSIPGKVFLMGEYAVLAEGPALIATVGPRFTLELTPDGEPLDFAPLSPAGRLFAWATARGLPIPRGAFQDPYRGEGGFGASSAQYAMSYAALVSGNRTEGREQEAWTLFRELTRGDALPPSGADLVAQWRGGTRVFQSRDFSDSRDYQAVLSQFPILVFSAAAQAGRKVATHEHLAKLADLRFPERGLIEKLNSVTAAGLSALERGEAGAFGASLADYARVLDEHGLECDAARKDRAFFLSEPGVLGAKGTGALQSDALVVVLDRARADREAIVARAAERGLRLVADGLKREAGITWQ